MSNKMLALVTGANKGIGFEVARQLARDHGYTVLVGARDAARGEEVAVRLRGEGLDAHGLTLDASDTASVQAAARAVTETWGRLDALVNNAGVGFDAQTRASEADPDEIAQTFATNVLGAWRATLAFLPLLRASPHGRIVNVSSQAGAFESTGSHFSLSEMGGTTAGYAASKAALNALTVKLALDLTDTGLRINAVCPGFTATFPGGEQMGARPVADGAASVVWGVTIADDGPSGGFFRDGQPLPW